MKRPVLGKNIQALLSVSSLQSLQQNNTVLEAPTSQATSVDGQLKKIAIEKINRSPFQPRREFNQEQLQELAESIKAQGVLQPIIVRQRNGNYELIAGERRWRASQIAGLTEIPAVIREMNDETVMAVALIENIQRQDLNPMEESYALQRLIDEFNMTHQQVAEAVGRSRTAVTNLLRLQQLAAAVKSLVEKSTIEMGHARALLSLEEKQQITIAHQIVEKELSVRQTEKIIRDLQTTKSTKTKSPHKDPDVAALERRLSEQLGTKVVVKHQTNGTGSLLIHYYSLEGLDGILERIK